MSSVETTEAATAAETHFGAGSLLILHLFVVWQVWMALGGWFALMHAFLPPLLPAQATGLIVRTPGFAMLCLTLSAMVLALAFMPLRHAMRSRGRWTRILSATAAIFWTPLLCGEAIRSALIEPTLASVTADCRGSILLIESIRSQLGGERPRSPHAWIVHGRSVRLWSYRTLRFEADPYWSGAATAIERCTSAGARKTSP